MTIPQTLAWVAPPARPSQGPTPRPEWTAASSIFPQREWLPRVFLIEVGSMEIIKIGLPQTLMTKANRTVMSLSNRYATK